MSKEETDGIQIINRRCKRDTSSPKKCKVEIPAKIKKEVGLYARNFGTASAIKKFATKYPKYSFLRTSVNTWKKKCNDDENWKTQPVRLWYAKRYCIGNKNGWQGGRAREFINSCRLMSVATEVVRVNNPNLLKKYDGNLVLSGGDNAAGGVVEKLIWSKHNSATGKVDPFPCLFLAKEKFTPQRNISALATEHDIPPSLIINIDQTPLLYVNTGKYTFSFKGARNISITGKGDKRQIRVTFSVSCTGEFLSIQLIYAWKIERRLPKYSFLSSFSVTFTENHWPNTEESVEFFKEIIFPYLGDTKQNKSCH